MEQNKQHVFVYGTLRPKNEEASHVLQGYALMDAGPYPYIVPDEDSIVYGSLLTVSDEELKAMDRYEGIDRGLYTRERVTVIEENFNSTETQAYVYVAGKDFPRPIRSGDWYNKEP